MINKEPLFTFKLPFGIWLCKYYLFTLITTTAQNPPPTLATYLHDAASLDTADPMEHRARSPSPKYLQPTAAAHTARPNWSQPVKAVALVQVVLLSVVPVLVKQHVCSNVPVPTNPKLLNSRKLELQLFAGAEQCQFQYMILLTLLINLCQRCSNFINLSPFIIIDYH